VLRGVGITATALGWSWLPGRTAEAPHPPRHPRRRGGCGAM